MDVLARSTTVRSLCSVCWPRTDSPFRLMSDCIFPRSGSMITRVVRRPVFQKQNGFSARKNNWPQKSSPMPDVNQLRSAWVGADAGYEKGPSFCIELDRMGEPFVVDLHSDFPVYLEDPEPYLPEQTNRRGRHFTRYRTDQKPRGKNGCSADEPFRAASVETSRYHPLSTEGARFAHPGLCLG